MGKILGFPIRLASDFGAKECICIISSTHRLINGRILLPYSFLLKYIDDIANIACLPLLE